jgi:hypothetical protein
VVLKDAVGWAMHKQDHVAVRMNLARSSLDHHALLCLGVETQML